MINENNSFINPKAKVGKDVEIAPFSYIAGDVEIGDGCKIGPNVTILDGARIGKNCTIHSGAVVSGLPQDLKFEGEVTTAVIGDNTTIRECVTINRGTKAAYTTKVGSGCSLMAYSHVAHDCVVGDNVIIGNAVALAGEVNVGDWAIISGGTLVHQFVHIGAHVIIGGGCKIRKDVPPFIKADREPISYVGVNSIGLKRRGFTDEIVHDIHEMYRHIYLSKKNNSVAVEDIMAGFNESPERLEVVTFIKNSQRGIIKGY